MLPYDTVAILNAFVMTFCVFRLTHGLKVPPMVVPFAVFAPLGFTASRAPEQIVTGGDWMMAIATLGGAAACLAILTWRGVIRASRALQRPQGDRKGISA